MSKVIKFEKPDKEKQFLESLDEWQTEIFLEIIGKAMQEFEEMQGKYFQKVCECEILKQENELLRGN